MQTQPTPRVYRDSSMRQYPLDSMVCLSLRLDRAYVNSIQETAQYDAKATIVDPHLVVSIHNLRSVEVVPSGRESVLSRDLD